MSKKLLVISIDAMGAKDLEGDLSHLPTLQNIQKMGSHIKNIKGVYPSVTYPAHSTIVTGVYPFRHGIINNTMLQPRRKSPDWYWYKKDMLVPTLFDVARKQGLKTAAFLWPVTANDQIDYHIAEIFPNRIWTNQVLVAMQASSPLFLLKMNHKYGYLRKGIQQPYLDEFTTACAIDTLRKKKPDLTMVHLTDLDTMRHKYGVSSKEAKQALKRQDIRVQQLIKATKEANTYDETTIVVLGDHYQIDVNKLLRLNALFAEKGWLESRADGSVKRNWRVYAKSCDGSTYVYCKKGFGYLKDQVNMLLKDIEGIENVYDTAEAKRFGADAQCMFMIEAKKGYFFIDEAMGAIVQEVKKEEIGKPDRYKAVHGYHPNKEEYDTTLLLMGEGIKRGFEVASANLVDEAPTFARILQLDTFPKNVDGKVIESIFKKV